MKIFLKDTPFLIKILVIGFVIFFFYAIYSDLFRSKHVYLSEKEKAAIDMNADSNASLSDDDFFALLAKTVQKFYTGNNCIVSKSASDKYIISISGDITRYWRDEFDSDTKLGAIASQHSIDQFLRVIQMSWKRLKQVEEIRIDYHSEDSSGQVADYKVKIAPRLMSAPNHVEEWNPSHGNTKTFLHDYILNNRLITVDTATGKRWIFVVRPRNK